MINQTPFMMRIKIFNISFHVIGGEKFGKHIMNRM